MADPPPAGDAPPPWNRKEKRKAAKKQKRKQARQDAAARQRQVDEALAADAEEQLRISLREKEEAELAERSRREFEERERLWLEAAAKRREQEEEEAHRRKLLEDSREHEEEEDDNDKWEYIEEGPAEIIWGENEIIVKKKRVKVLKNCSDHSPGKKEEDRPTSNPLPPQSVAFSEFQNGPPLSAQELLESVAQQTPNFGTEQDKAHCPFHLKTGACRFGMRCSRVHFYPDKANTLLMKNMYTGPGLAWELDEGLELPTVEQLLSQYQCYAFDGQCTDEEVAWGYEEFYEDVHTEFLKFGEIVNFKVCRNSSVHLRGNVYVHYKSVESAVLAYNTINGRYFAGKQIKCEFVGVTRWKIAICGEYMKTKLKTCSRGAACNFIHCFRNPGGDYEWADWDNPPPRHWIKKMVVLFGHSVHNELGDIEHREGYSSKKISYTNKRLHSKSSGHGDYNQDSDYENETNSWEERHGNHTSKREHSRKWRERRQSDDDAEQPERKSKASEPNGGHVSRGHIAKRGFSRDKESSEYKNNDLEDYDRFYKRHRSVTSRSKREGKYNNDGDNNSEGSYKCSKGHDRRGSSSRSKTKEKCNSYRYKDSERSYRSSKGYGWKGSLDCDIRGLGDAECSGQTSSNRKSRSVSDNHTGHYDEWLHDCSADKELSWKDQINQVDVIKSREDHEYPERYTPLAYELDENKCQRHKSEDRSISSGESPSGSKNLKRQAHHRESRERYISRERASSYTDSHNGRKKESPSIHKEHTEMLDEEDCCSFDSKDLENTSECSDSDDSLQHRETMHGRSYRSKHEKKRKHEYEYPRGTRDHGTSSPGERRFGKTLQD